MGAPDVKREHPVGLTHVDAVVTGPDGRSESIEFLVDSGATYTVLPWATWQAIGLAPKRVMSFRLADGTVVRRSVSECHVALCGVDGHSPVILGEERDVPLLGMVTLETLALALNPFERTLGPLQLLLV